MATQEQKPQAKRLSAFERFTAALLGVPKFEADALDTERKAKREREKATTSDERH